MIPSAKSQWFSRWFAAQAHRRLRATFGALHHAGLDTLRAALRRGPVLVVSNHSSWWDPLVALLLTQRLVPADGHALMDADNLRRLPFFAKVGAFGVDRGSRRDGAEATRYAVDLLDRPGRLVWIFPQGEERPLHERPLRFFGGAARVAQRAPEVTVLPVALSYGFGAREAPEAFVAVGPAIPPEAAAVRARRAQEQAVQVQLERVEAEQRQPGGHGFETIELRTPGVLARLAEGMLAVMSRPFVPGLASIEPPVGAQPQRSLAPAHPRGTEGGPGESGQ